MLRFTFIINVEELELSSRELVPGFISIYL